MNNRNVISLAAKRVMKQERPLIFIVSEDYPDGNVMTQEAYRELQKHMDACDRACHQWHLIDADIASFMVATLDDISTVEDIQELKASGNR